MKNWKAKRASRIYKSEKVLSKFNPYHDAAGRFTTAEGNVTGKGGATGGKGGASGAKKKYEVKLTYTIKDSETVEVKADSEYDAESKYKSEQRPSVAGTDFEWSDISIREAGEGKYKVDASWSYKDTEYVEVEADSPSAAKKMAPKMGSGPSETASQVYQLADSSVEASSVREGRSTGDAMRANRKEREQEARRKEGKYTHAIFQSKMLGPNPSAAEMARKARDLQNDPDFNKSVEKHGIEEAIFRESKKESTRDANRMLNRIADIYVNTHPSDRANEVEEMVDRHRPVGMWGHELPHRKLLQRLEAVFADVHPQDQDYEIEAILERYDVPQPERTYE